MVASDMATTIMKPPKVPSAPRAKSTSAQQTTKPIYTRTLKANTTSTANSVYKSRSDTSLTNSIRNLSIRSGSASSSRSSASSGSVSGARRFNSAGRGSKNIEEIAHQIANKHFKNIVVMAGAGISTASGIPDFRTPGTGLYDNLRQYSIPYPQAVFDIDYFARNPKPFYALAKELYPSGKYRPNYVHYFLRLLYEKGILLRVYTQNIDGLERLAGIPPAKLVEAHGSFVSASCIHCKQAYPQNEVKGAILGNKIPRCKKGGCYGTVKPDIVFFGEDLPRRFYYYLRDFPQADLLLVMGTSLEVEPFAGIVDSVRMYVPRILFNREAVGPFEKKRRMNDIVVEDYSFRYCRSTGDIVEKIRGFVMQLGWKKELEMLIEECENQYKRSLIESPLAVNQVSSPSLSMSRDTYNVNTNSLLSKPSNSGLTRAVTHMQGFCKSDQSKPKTPPQEVNKIKEDERKNITQAPATVKAPPAQGATNTKGRERVIAGPNSCFNPAQLRFTRIAPTAVDSAAGSISQRTGATGDTTTIKTPAESANYQEGKAEPSQTGGGDGTKCRDGGRGGTEKPDDGNCEKSVRTEESKPPSGQGHAQCLAGGPAVRHSFEGVKRILGEAARELQNTPLPVVPSENPLSNSSNPAQQDKKSPRSTQDDDLKGFFTMPDTSKPKKLPERHPRPSHSAQAGGSSHRSPRCTEFTSSSEGDMAAAAQEEDAQRDVMIKEWLAAGPGGQSSEVNVSGAQSDEDLSGNIKPVPRSRSNSAHSTIRRQNSLANENHSRTISREIVRLKMRYNLSNQPQPQTSLFQRTHKVPSHSHKVTGETAPVRYAKSPTRYAFKHTKGVTTPPKSPAATEVRKPLFTGLRHVNLKSQSVTATVTKTTITSNSAKTRTVDREAEQVKAHSAGALPRISYQHRQTSDISSNARSSRLTTLLAQTAGNQTGGDGGL